MSDLEDIIVVKGTPEIKAAISASMKQVGKPEATEIAALRPPGGIQGFIVCCNGS